MKSTFRTRRQTVERTLRKNGNENSANGTMTKKEKGTRRKRSAEVRNSCLRSRRVSVSPWVTRRISRNPILASATNSLLPAQ